jgi:hypothetical protein
LRLGNLKNDIQSKGFYSYFALDIDDGLDGILHQKALPFFIYPIFENNS